MGEIKKQMGDFMIKCPNKLTDKKDYERLLLSVLNPLKPFYSPGKAYLEIGNTATGYRKKTAKIEAFARPLWGLAPYYAFPKDKDMSFADIYTTGLANGTNPLSDEYWWKSSEDMQIKVEMAAMGTALILAPETFFYSLKEEDRLKLASWLYSINESYCYETNWIFFVVLVNIGLKKVNMPYSQEKIEWALKLLDDWYIGQGWYTDGVGEKCDYYNPFAFHFYSLIYAKSIEIENPERSKKLKDRAKIFAEDFIYWFDKRGDAVAYGRSLTYRFAQVAFWAALVWADASPFSLGVVKGIINRHLKSWINAPIFDNANILTIGYKYPNLRMSESYNAPGSPYWAMKAFLILALPEDHLFFSIEEEPLPELKNIKILSAPQMVVSNNKDNALLYVSGGYGDHPDFGMFPEKYCKFVYSSKYGFSISYSNRSLEQSAPDSTMTFIVNGVLYHKDNPLGTGEIIDNKMHIDWSPCPGISVKTVISVYENYHIREHFIESNIICEAVDAGYAIPLDDENCEKLCEQNTAMYKSNESGCKVVSDNGEGLLIAAYPNTNLICNQTIIPAVKIKISKGSTHTTTYVYDV